MPHIKKKNSTIKAWGPNVKQKIRGKITFINSRVKLKKFKHFTKKKSNRKLKIKRKRIKPKTKTK